MTTSGSPRLLTQLALLFPSSERLRLAVVLLTAILVAMFEALGVASIVPFMAVLMDPGSLDRYEFLRTFTKLFNATTTHQQLVVLGVFTVATVVASNSAGALGLYVQQKFVARTRIRLNTVLFDTYLRLPLSFHTARDSASLLKVIFADAEAAARLVGSLIQFVARALVIATLLALLLMQNPKVALLTLGGMGGCYLAVYWLVRQKQDQLGRFVSGRSAARHRSAQEGLGGVKDLRILGREAYVVAQFRDSTRDVCDAQVSNVLTSSLPRFILEPVAFGGIVALALFTLLRDGGNAASTIPTLALYALVGYRLLPALQQLFTAAVDIRFTAPSLKALHDDWQLSMHTQAMASAVDAETTNIPVDPTGAIVLEDVSFTYPGASQPALSGITLSVRAGESIGLVGRTGSGKTTLADIVLGLHEPNTGSLSVGSLRIEESTVRSWRRHVGYVPQAVYLANATVSENIAFGLPLEQIDQLAVQRAAKMAQAEEFIAAMPSGYDTVIGERGVMLSGGQRQRLGIARALYHDPQLLVFDEATSALDGMTEDAVMDAVHALSGSRTVILIAHRLRTVEACDRILLLERGRIVESGPFQQLVHESAEFRRMVGQSTQVAAT